MATQRRFEGSTLAAVLAKVQKEVGPSAKIIKAQKVRSGGVLGFFAREKFEVIVEVDEATAVVPVAPTPASTIVIPPPTITAGTSLDDIVAQINNEERRVDEPVKSRPKATKAIKSADLPPAAPTATAPAAPAAVPAPAAKPKAKAAPSPSPKPAPEPVRAEPAPIPENQISTESDSFAEVLSRMAFQSDMKSTPSVEEQVQPILDARDIIESGVVDGDDDDINDDLPDPMRFAEADDEEEYELPDGESVYVDVTEEAPAPPEMTVPDRPSFLDLPKVPAVAERNVDGLAVPVTRTRKSDSPLALLGVPVQYIPDRLDLTDLVVMREMLTIAFHDIPQSPTIRPSRGSIIAVVGERNEAMNLAEELADSYGRPRDEVVLASPDYRGREVGSSRLLKTVRDAEDAQRSWQRRNRPTIVAIEADLGGRAVTWAEHVLTALEPIATYGVTDATRKSEDIAAWAAALGGIDCLAVNHIHETISPAAVLATGIPVDRLDGRQASPAYWAMLLSERLAAA